MKKRLTCMLLAAVLAVSLFGCSGGGTQSTTAPAGTTTPTAAPEAPGVVEELRIGTTTANDVFTTFMENGAFGKMCYNSFVTAPFWQTGPTGEVEPYIVTDWSVS